MQAAPNLISADKLVAYKNDLKGPLVLNREFRAPSFALLRNVLTNPLEELVCLTNPDKFVRDFPPIST